MIDEFGIKADRRHERAHRLATKLLDNYTRAMYDGCDMEEDES